jgi:acetate kinase
MSKDESSPSLQKEKLSFCDIMKEDTSDILKKMELKMPSVLQNYSNLYIAYLHMFDDVFDTCYIAEKEFFDNLNIDQGVLKQVKEISKAIKENCLENIDVASKFFDEYVKMRTSAIKSFDIYFHTMMESYAKMLPSKPAKLSE